MYWNGESTVSLASDSGLTLTWDVLKWDFHSDIQNGSEININMRCIEMSMVPDGSCIPDGLTLTWDVLKLIHPLTKIMWLVININMRCIEIKKFVEQTAWIRRLTLTWDVLKF